MGMGNVFREIIELLQFELKTSKTESHKLADIFVKKIDSESTFQTK